MGAFSPANNWNSKLQLQFDTEIMKPLLRGLIEEGVTFRGLLYPGLIITSDGPRVLEFNCRFGDPETQAVLPLMRSSLLEPMTAIASGSGLSGASNVEWDSAFAVTTVLATRGYPDAPVTGDPITLPAAPNGVIAFHAGTARDTHGALVTSGGRVIAATAVARTFDRAQQASADYAAAVEFNGKQFRADIGWRESARRARAT